MIEIKDAANAPWHEVQRLFSMMQSFRVQFDKAIMNPVDLLLDDSRNLTIKVELAKAEVVTAGTEPRKAKRPVGRPPKAKGKR